MFGNKDGKIHNEIATCVGMIYDIRMKIHEANAKNEVLSANEQKELEGNLYLVLKKLQSVEEMSLKIHRLVENMKIIEG